MSEMIERVARAICKSRTCEGGSCCQWPGNTGRTNCNAKQGAYDDAARAAIEAMREPTPEMLAAGYEKGPTAAKYTAMIDAALKPEVQR